MVVEFVGLSGVGKSTLVGELQARLAAMGTPVTRVSGRAACGEDGPRLGRWLALARALLRQPLACLRLAGALAAAAASGESRLGRVARVRLALKWFRRLPVYADTVARARAAGGTWLMERGLVTNLLSVAMRSGPRCLAPLLACGGRLGAEPGCVVLVLADADTVRARRAGRGGEAKHWMDVDDWEQRNLAEAERLLREMDGQDRLRLCIARADDDDYPQAVVQALLPLLCGAARSAS